MASAYSPLIHASAALQEAQIMGSQKRLAEPPELQADASPPAKPYWPVLRRVSVVASLAPPHVAGLDACLQAWAHIRAVPAQNWMRLPNSEEDAAVITAWSTARSNFGAGVTLNAVASEVEHTLEHGMRSTTALACILLASVALNFFKGGKDALTLAETALGIAMKPGHQDYKCIGVIHASLITPRTAGLDQVAHLLGATCKDESLPLAARLHLTRTAFTSGIPLIELLHHLEKLRRYQKNQGDEYGAETLSLRSGLLRALQCPEIKPDLEDLCRQLALCQDERFDYALAQLQTFWFAGNYARAEDASRRAARLLTPLTPIADVLCYHLFSALTLGRLESANVGAAVAIHCVELARLARASSASVSVVDELAAAVCDRCAGKTLVALSALEHAYNNAARLGQHWIAAVAAEEAALAASQARLHSAVDHYRRRALSSYNQWGALGRIDMLNREWGCVEGVSAVETHSENTLHHAGGAEETELSIAHEINQPLAAIALHAGAARKWLSRAKPNVERALESLGAISEAGYHAGEIVRVVKRLASHEENEVKRTNVDQTILDVLRLLQRNLRKQGIRTELALNLCSATIQANRVQLQQVITNLLVNAIEALSDVQRAPGARYIRIGSSTVSDQEIEITIEDNGPGVESTHRDRIFSSLFTTKAGNTGLGLSISLAIIRAHHGSIAFEPCDPHGARFRIRFPIHRPL